MIWYIIDLYASFTPMFSYVLNHIFLLAFIATVPFIIMGFFRR